MSAGKIILLIILVLGIGYYFYKSKVQRDAASTNLAISYAFLTENKLKPDVKTTDSGLQYKILEESGNTEKPKATDVVLVHYHGTLLNGEVFDSSVQRGEPISFPLNRVIKGWTEGLQLMSPGDKFRFFIPADLAYGNRGAGKIEPGSALIFDVELIQINP
ncbi:FKBP-type peptidyl-prolyl cis-trans isomerase [Alteromonas sediminis]|uniref:Peptidyl-prolyl cis-trans isomerase n=1 Tax=Alteromonas sediminis TaxID=2259342 RepID=A0A3N5XWW3_9ALTE|nr:FKBP-type peptidyl-prolyl cis-trans isomerase [Alteromonas sediminis]RPJ64910.1 FKBP-type peptidyl-prolyl cis-trans isomerase [Alteromonas sediminis]